jgi:biopolymer transport protein ExbB
MLTKLQQLLEVGGLVLLPIVGCSVVALAITLERLWALRRRAVVDERAVAAVFAHVHDGDVRAALAVTMQQPLPQLRVLAAVLRQAGRPRARIRAALDDAGRAEIPVLERFVEGLATIATITPLLGLLGTVLGMIEAFRLVELHGFGDPSRFASGIWQALVTTAAGLVVAIPAFAVYRALLARIDRFLRQLEQTGLALLDLVAAPDEPGDATSSRTTP